MQPSSFYSIPQSNLSLRQRFLILSLLLFLMASLTGVHAYVKTQGPEYAGFLLFVDHLFDIILVLIILAICTALGKRLLTCCRYELESPLETVLFSVGIGCGVVSTVLLILGFLSGLQTIILAATLVILGLLARNEITGLPSLVVHAAVEVKTRSNILALLVFATVAAFVISQALLPPSDWDDLMYHLRVPSQFLAVGRIYVPEDNLHVALVQLVHMLYLPLLSYGSVSGPALLSASFALLLGLAVFALSNRFFEGPTVAFSLALLWGTTMVPLVAITARVDITLAYYLFLAHFALLKSSSNWKSFYLSAVLLGFAIGLKHHAVVYAAALGPLIVWQVFSQTRSVAASTRCLMCFGLLLIAVSLPWLAKNWLLLEAPLYPVFAQRQLPSWLAFLYTERYVSTELNPQIWTMLGQVRSPFNLIDLFLNPSTLTVEAEGFFYTMNPLLLSLPLWVIYYRKDTTLNWLMIPALTYLSAVVLFSPRTNLRYLMPFIAPFTIAAAHVTVGRLMRLFGRKGAVVLFYFLSLVVLWPSAKTMILWTTQKMTVAYLTGSTSREDYLLNDMFPTNYSGLAHIVSYVNRHIPSGSKVLFLFEARGFYFDIPVIQDNVLTNWPLLASRASSLHCLESTGISHVLLNRGALNYYLGRGMNHDTIAWDTFRHFEDECLTVILEGPTHILYRVGK